MESISQFELLQFSSCLVFFEIKRRTEVFSLATCSAECFKIIECFTHSLRQTCSLFWFTAYQDKLQIFFFSQFFNFCLIVFNFFYQFGCVDRVCFFVIYHRINFFDSIVSLHSTCVFDIVSIQHNVAVHTSSVAIFLIESVFQNSSFDEVHILCICSMFMCST